MNINEAFVLFGAVVACTCAYLWALRRLAGPVLDGSIEAEL